MCCVDQLPTRVESRAQSIVVNTDSCDREGTHWVAFQFPKEGPAEFFDSFGRAPETYHGRFRNVLITNGPQYKFITVRVQPEDGDTCGLYCVHFVKYRYRNFTLEDIVKEFSARELKTIEAELKDIYEGICVQHIVNKKNWIRIFVIVHALNHSSHTQYSPFRIFVLLIPTCLCRIEYCQRLL